MKASHFLQPVYWRQFQTSGSVTPPPPILTLTAIDPSKAPAGSAVVVLFTGTGFDGTNLAVHISEVGVLPGSPAAIHPNSFLSTFTVARNAKKGPRFVSVSTVEGGQVGNQQFNVTGGGNSGLFSALSDLFNALSELAD